MQEASRAQVSIAQRLCALLEFIARHSVGLWIDQLPWSLSNVHVGLYGLHLDDVGDGLFGSHVDGLVG
jgi:hypothetical protein